MAGDPGAEFVWAVIGCHCVRGTTHHNPTKIVRHREQVQWLSAGVPWPLAAVQASIAGFHQGHAK